jgi:hypothetical protein
VLLLAEVALGRTYQTHGSENMTWDRIQKEKKSDSLQGVGRMAASEGFHETM